MPTFEVTIADPDDAARPKAAPRDEARLKVLVEAPHWIDAWREGLRVLGEGPPPADAECDVRSDQSVLVWVPGAGRAWEVRPAPEAPAGAPSRLGAGGAVLLSVAPDASTPATAFRVRPASGDPAPPARQPLQRTPAPSPRPGQPTPPLAVAPGPASEAPPSPGTTDPLARRLDTQDRARLGLRGRSGLRVSVPSVSHDAPPTTGRGRRPAESTRVGRPASPPSPGASPTGAGTADTSDFQAVGADAVMLPQQFRAVSLPAPGTPTAVTSAQEAVENAWQHIPCQLAQALRRGESGALEVVAARGERERETLRCCADADPSFERWLTQGPARVKFAEDRSRVRYLGPRGEPILDVPVRSALCVPVRVEDGRWGLLLLLNSTRASGFAEGEMRAVSYLATTLSRALAEQDRALEPAPEPPASDI